jgi:DNA polymerase-3 subunit alpha
MTPLQTTTAFTLLHSPMLPADMVRAAKSNGYQAIALTDTDVLYGMDNFYRTAVSEGIKPILGLQALVGGILNKSQAFPVIFLVENQVGYHNLIKISSLIKSQNDDETVTFDELVPLLEGLYFIFPEVSELQLLLAAEPDEALHLVQEVGQIIRPEAVFLGVTLEMNQAVRDRVAQLAKLSGTRVVAVDPVSYVEPSDQFAQQVLQKVSQGEPITNISAARREPGTQALRAAVAMQTAYERVDLAEAVENTDWIAAHSEFEMSRTTQSLPHFETPNQQSSQEYLHGLAINGLKARLQGTKLDAEIYQERLEDELKIIHRLGFDDYFLIVWDVMNFAHNNDIRTGPGRGSAAGSLVAYTLWITDVDPIAFDLLFERFLNPERAQMPDIDIDIPDNKRETVLNYLHEKYGHERVAQIITFSTLGTRAVIRDVARAFGLNPQQIDTLSKSLPADRNLDLAGAYEQSQKFRNALLDLPVDGELLLETAKKLAGLPRNASLHAAGVVLSADPLVETVPVELGEDGRLVTQLTKNPVEAIGLLKMDFLALSNLSILDIALHEVARQNDGQTLNISKINLNDTQTLELFQRGQTNGIFQFESAGMKNMLRQLKPDSFEDIVAANALFRPGPSQNIGHFIARKHGQEPQDVPDASVAEILAPTYGIIVYQEQVMRVAEQFAGFTLGEADLLRRAMSKKDAEKIAAVRSDFISGAVKLGHSETLSGEVFGYIETFAQYGFNRSHAVAYSKLAFQLAYLKTHYPAAFYKAVLNDAMSDKKKLQIYTAEARQAGVKLNGPSINKSYRGFSMTDGELQMGLGSIKGLRSDFIKHLIEERTQNGPYKDLANLIGRLDNRYRKQETLEPLIYAGALDEFGFNRKTLIASLRGFIEAVGLAGESMSLFASFAPKVKEVPEFAPNERLGYEYDTLGVYLSGHPLEPVLAAIPTESRTDVANLTVGMDRATVVLYIESVKEIRTKKGDQMAFVDGIDLSGNLSVTVFPKLFDRFSALLKPENILVITGKVEQQRDRDDLQLIANDITSANTLLQSTPKQVAESQVSSGTWFLRVPEAAEEAVGMQLSAVFSSHAGSNPVLLVYEKGNKKIALGKENWLDDNAETQEILRGILGPNNVVFQPNN